MAQRSQGCLDIKISMCKIRKHVAGNHLVTTGSACVLRWPWKIASATSQETNQTFVVTTSQVVSKSDLNSSTVWRADFLPLKWQRSETFTLNDATVHEICIPYSQNHAITLILIPTESLHTQKRLSRWRADQLQSSRSQPCQQEENELVFQAADGKQPLCFVLSETALENDKFSLQCYLLCKDESGSYFLQDHGNKAQLRTLKDFQSTEKPRGSIILNEDGHALGFLAFDDKDEILPLFLVQNMQGGEDTKTTNGITQECSAGNDGVESQTGGSLADVNNIPFRSLSIETSPKDTATSSQPDTEHPDPSLVYNEGITGNRSQPRESSFHSFGPHTAGGGDETGRSGDAEHQLRNGAVPSGSNRGNKAEGTRLGRYYSMQPTLTPRTQRRLLTSQSVLDPIPLRSDALVSNVILPKVYVMDTISRHLDMSCKGTQNWRHLADLHSVSTDLQWKWQSGEHHCRSEKMFDVLSASQPDLLLKTLKQHLTDLKINNVAYYIGSLNLDDDKKVKDFFESTADLNKPGRVLIMLDLLPEETWQNLGVNLGVKRETLKSIKTACANQQEDPADHVMDIIKTSNPYMTIAQFRQHLTDIERSDVAKTLEKLQENSTIDDLAKELDLMRVVTSMLNGPDNSHLKNYKDLAKACNISSELYQSLQPPCADSPTEKVIDDIVTHRPKFTVEELLTNFRDMKRLDVIKAITCYFEAEDMMAMKRKLKISDE